jgi:hypothetical protein
MCVLLHLSFVLGIAIFTMLPLVGDVSSLLECCGC